jgi:D-alanyl-D-alanine carboxypeptidase (penicillin-binding protein 5/6)
MNGFRKLLVPLALLAPWTANALDITAKSAIVIDDATGKVLWSKDPDTPRYPASTTKIMTGLLLLEHSRPTDIIVAPADVSRVKESSMHLKPGERVSVHDMLYALLLRSANDAAYAIAIHVAGSVPKFSALMNARAKELGCTHTHFDNPNGLNDVMHYTSAHDLALIAREAMKRPDFREVVRTYRYQIQRSIDQHDCVMVNHDKWLAKDMTADGIKTGWTVPAGHCFVGSSTRNGYRVIAVEMNSKHWELDHQAMIDWAFANHVRIPLISRDVALGTIPVVGGATSAVSFAPASNVDSLVSKAAAKSDMPAMPLTTLELAPELHAPVHKGDFAGTVVVRDPEGFDQRVAVVATADVLPAPPAVVASAKSGGSMAVLGGALLLGTVYMRGRVRRFRIRRARFSGARKTS